jgi:hypothetical protein
LLRTTTKLCDDFIHGRNPVANHKENHMTDQQAAELAEYEWKQRRIREALAAYLKRQARGAA